MKIIILSFFLLIGLYGLNGAITPIEINDFYQLGDNGTKSLSYEEKILHILDEFTKRMCHELKIGEFELPVLDPIKIVDAFDLPIPIPNFEIVRLGNLNVKGLSDITIENLRVRPSFFQFTGQIKLDSINLMTDYKIKGKISDLLEIDGEGKLRLDIGANIDFDIRLGMHPETKKLLINIPKLEPKLIVNIFKITGLFPDDELNKLIEDMVKDIGHELFNDIWQDNKKFVIELIQMLATTPFADMTAKELLALIASDEPIFGEDDPPPDCKD